MNVHSAAQSATTLNGYAGDIPPEQAWHWAQTGLGVLVDIRTSAETTWVGRVPGALMLPWRQWPGMEINPHFAQTLRASVLAQSRLLLLCRSGMRSVEAALYCTSLGFEAYNVLEGFEGQADMHGHRNSVNGWRFRGLPWVQG